MLFDLCKKAYVLEVLNNRDLLVIKMKYYIYYLQRRFQNPTNFEIVPANKQFG